MRANPARNKDQIACLKPQQNNSPSKYRYDVLRFFKTCLTKEGWKWLLEGLSQMGIRTKRVFVSNNPGTKDPELETLCRNELGAKLLR